MTRLFYESFISLVTDKRKLSPSKYSPPAARTSLLVADTLPAFLEVFRDSPQLWRHSISIASTPGKRVPLMIPLTWETEKIVRSKIRCVGRLLHHRYVFRFFRMLRALCAGTLSRCSSLEFSSHNSRLLWRIERSQRCRISRYTCWFTVQPSGMNSMCTMPHTPKKATSITFVFD